MRTEAPLLRPATPEDAPKIARLHADSWRRTYRGVFSDAFLEGDLEAERCAVWERRLTAREPPFVVVADGGNELQGFVCAYPGGDPGWGVFIDNLHVHASCKGRGLGTALLCAAAEWAETERPGLPMYLWVLEPNVAAQRFYEARGGTRRESVSRENPGGGFARYLRYGWSDPGALRARR